MQRSDFYEIFKAMDGLPVTIRTLDPPLHEFLPHEDAEIRKLAEKLKLSPDKVKARVDSLKEANPMLGLRGCRLGILYPEITSMQARAIIEAACDAASEGVEVLPEIMIPLVGSPQEFTLQKTIVEEVAQKVLEEKETKLNYLIGTMIELPRAALAADQIVKSGAQFFSFGTNDLTQTTFGLSRDDSGSFLDKYVELGVWQCDPFVSLDQEGVGQLIVTAVDKGRSIEKKLKIGICGEHGGDPESVKFCCANGFDYVSCSPLRVPIARLAAAQYLLEGEDAGAGLPRKRRPGRPKGSSAKAKPKARAKAKSARGTRAASTRKTGARKTTRTATRKTATRPSVRRGAATTRKSPAKRGPGRPPSAKKLTKRGPGRPTRKVAATKRATTRVTAKRAPARKAPAKKTTGRGSGRGSRR
jgi:pyruvate,orthophosphate dikinase